VTRFLRFFYQFRSLEAELAEAAGARISAEDRERLWRARCDVAESDKDKARAAETHALKVVADWIAFINGMPPVHGVASLPVSKPDSEPFEEPRRRQARDVVRESDEEFRSDYAALIDQEFERQYGK
jgi:hypothetical protein